MSDKHKVCDCPRCGRYPVVLAERDRWKGATERLVKCGSNVEDILQVPDFLGASSSAICQKAIDEFRESLATYESALKEGL